MKRNTLLSFLFVLFFWESIAQSTYLKPLDDPDRRPGLGFLIEPWYLDTWKANMVGGGFGMGMDFHLKRFVDLQCVFRVSYADKEYEKNYATKNAIGPAIFLDAVLGLNFLNHYSVRDEKVTISSFGDGSYTYIQVPVKQRASLSCRTGFALNATTYTGSNLPTYSLDSNGTVTEGSDKNYYTFFYLPVGLSFKTVRHAILSVNGRKNRAYGDSWEFYLDALPLLKVKMKQHHDLFDTSLVSDVAPKFKSPAGWRFGLRVKPSGRPGLFMGMEFGSRPGPGNGQKGKNDLHNYFLLHLGFVITEMRRV